MKTSLKDNNMSMYLEIQVDNNKQKALQKISFTKLPKYYIVASHKKSW